MATKLTLFSRSQLLEALTGQKPVLLNLFLIPIVVCLLSLTPVFIRICEQEITPNVITFNRFWMAAVGIGLWQRIAAISSPEFNHPYDLQQSLTASDAGVGLANSGRGTQKMTDKLINNVAKTG